MVDPILIGIGAIIGFFVIIWFLLKEESELHGISFGLSSGESKKELEDKKKIKEEYGEKKKVTSSSKEIDSVKNKKSKDEETAQSSEKNSKVKQKKSTKVESEKQKKEGKEKFKEEDKTEKLKEVEDVDISELRPLIELVNELKGYPIDFKEYARHACYNLKIEGGGFDFLKILLTTFKDFKSKLRSFKKYKGEFSDHDESIFDAIFIGIEEIDQHLTDFKSIFNHICKKDETLKDTRKLTFDDIKEDVELLERNILVFVRKLEQLVKIYIYFKKKFVIK